MRAALVLTGIIPMLTAAAAPVAQESLNDDADVEAQEDADGEESVEADAESEEAIKLDILVRCQTNCLQYLACWKSMVVFR